VIVVVGAQGEQVRRYLVSEYRCPFRFVQQTDPKGLGDAVYRARDSFAGEPILILLGDTIVDLDMSKMVGRNNIIGVKPVPDPRRFGIVELDGKYVRRLVEKPERPKSNLAIVGVYFLRDSARLFGALERLIARGRRTRGEFQLTDALQLLIRSGLKISTRVIEHWLDCGTREAMLETNRYLLARASSCRARPDTVVVPPVFIHDSAKIHGSVIGPNVSVGAEAEIRGSIVSDSIVQSSGRTRLCATARAGSTLAVSPNWKWDDPRK